MPLQRKVFPDIESLSQGFADFAATALQNTLSRKPQATLVVPGGSTPNMFGMSPTEEEYTTYIPSFLHQGGPTGKGSFGYLEALATKGRYPHVVWPVHCVVGSWGWGLVDELAQNPTEVQRAQAALEKVLRATN